MQDIVITLIQSNLQWEDTDANLLNFTRKIDLIKDDSDIIILPEMFSTGFTMNPEKCAEDMNGRTINWMKQQAKNKNAVILGSVIIKESISEQRIKNNKQLFYNRLIWMQPDGSYSKYDKRHLFRLGKETEFYKPGKEILITKWKGWKFRPLVCYDLRFPVWSRNKMVGNEYEYDCLIYIANWPKSRVYAWKSLMVGRAIENQAYALGVNRIGEDGNGVPHNGDSIAVDYKGNILHQFKSGEEEIITMKLSYVELINYRKKFAFGLDWDNFRIEG